MRRRTWHLTVYEVDRVYGGPEEGGWWFDTGRVVHRSVLAGYSEEEALAVRDALEDRIEKPYPRVGSVLYRGGEYRVAVSRTRGEDYPTLRPVYS